MEGGRAVPGVPARPAEAHLLGLEHDRRHAPLAQMDGGREAGIAGADDAYGRLDGALERACVGGRGCRRVPERGLERRAPDARDHRSGRRAAKTSRTLRGQGMTLRWRNPSAASHDFYGMPDVNSGCHQLWTPSSGCSGGDGGGSATARYRRRPGVKPGVFGLLVNPVGCRLGAMRTRSRAADGPACPPQPLVHSAVRLGELMTAPAWLWAQAMWSAVHLLDRPPAGPAGPAGKAARVHADP